MSKSFAATKRDLHDFWENTREEDQWTADWKLTRHPNGKKKHKFVHYGFNWGHQWGSPRQMERKATQRAKQRVRQLDRTHRKEETQKIIKEYINEQD